MSVDGVLLMIACICFVLSAVNVKSSVNLQSAGLALWMLSLLL